MARKYTVEQLKARQEKLRVASERQRRELAALKRRVDREEAARELEALAALGRAVQATLGLTTPADWATWWAQSGVELLVHKQDMRATAFLTKRRPEDEG
jgi:hypothetical protein